MIIPEVASSLRVVPLAVRLQVALPVVRRGETRPFTDLRAERYGSISPSRTRD